MEAVFMGSSIAEERYGASMGCGTGVKGVQDVTHFKVVILKEV